MPDPITTLGLVKTTTDLVKDAIATARESKNTDLAEKLIEVYQNMVEILDTNRQLREQISQLQSEIAKLKAQDEAAKNLDYNLKLDVYFPKDSPLDKDGDPTITFCKVCHDVDGKLVRTQGPYCEFCGKHRPRGRH